MTDLLFYGISFSLFLSLLICVILLLKKLLSGRITASAHYYLWFVPPAGFGASLLPGLFPVFSPSVSDSSPVSPEAASALRPQQEALQDLFVNTRGLIPQSAAAAVLIIWILGALLMLLRVFYGIYGIHRLRGHAAPASSPVILRTLRRCLDKLHMKRPAQIRISRSLKSPAAMGIIRPCILLPEGCREEHLPYILLHELIHCRHRDALLNLIMQLFLAFNWYNPLVWYAVKQMESDRELCCDSFALKALDREGRIAYGRAVIECAAGAAFPAVGMKQTAKPLHKRIAHIASFHLPKAGCRRISRLLLAAMVLASACFAPSASSLTGQSYEPEAGMEIRYEHLEQYFGDLDGAFVLYDLNRDAYTIHNPKAASARVSPDSTYKIYSSLLALESGLEEASHQRWDGTVYPLDAWNRDQSLSSAMKGSVNWYFQKLDERSGKDRLQKFYESIGYGNCDLRGGLSRYWLESSLKISPLEQVMLLSDFYENKWELREANVAAVKDALRISHSLSGKTGTGMVDGRTVNGWFIGYTEAPSGPQFFALNLRGRDGASGARASEIARHILKDKGLL